MLACAPSPAKRMGVSDGRRVQRRGRPGFPSCIACDPPPAHWLEGPRSIWPLFLVGGQVWADRRHHTKYLIDTYGIQAGASPRMDWTAAQGLAGYDPAAIRSTGQGLTRGIATGYCLWGRGKEGAGRGIGVSIVGLACVGASNRGRERQPACLSKTSRTHHRWSEALSFAGHVLSIAPSLPSLPSGCIPSCRVYHGLTNSGTAMFARRRQGGGDGLLQQVVEPGRGGSVVLQSDLASTTASVSPTSSTFFFPGRLPPRSTPDDSPGSESQQLGVSDVTGVSTFSLPRQRGYAAFVI
ncbi:hypothetical protein GQ53DRAFT_330840 [Thozetella sp. PMI_491]|nr:hypothetical protein GQ53DRAFT_330840 [Thozetella sp. PMI_491]